MVLIAPRMEADRYSTSLEGSYGLSLDEVARIKPIPPPWNPRFACGWYGNCLKDTSQRQGS